MEGGRLHCSDARVNHVKYLHTGQLCCEERFLVTCGTSFIFTVAGSLSNPAVCTMVPDLTGWEEAEGVRVHISLRMQFTTVVDALGPGRATTSYASL